MWLIGIKLLRVTLDESSRTPWRLADLSTSQRCFRVLVPWRAPRWNLTDAPVGRLYSRRATTHRPSPVPPAIRHCDELACGAGAIDATRWVDGRPGTGRPPAWLRNCPGSFHRFYAAMTLRCFLVRLTPS